MPNNIQRHIAKAVRWQRGSKDNKPGWIIMEKANTDLFSNHPNSHEAKKDACELFLLLHDEGWAVSDLHNNNLGKINNRTVVIDYYGLRPLRLMSSIIKNRVEKGVVTTGWGDSLERLNCNRVRGVTTGMQSF